MSFLFEYGLFLAKLLTLLLIFVLPCLLVAVAVAKHKGQKGALEVTDLSQSLTEHREALQASLLEGAALKRYRKELKQTHKRQAKARAEGTRPRLFVVDFKGSMDAHEAASLREEVTAILGIAKPEDEVLVRLESGGGVVHGYGLCASQLQRLRERGLRLTVAIDKVAASGGYMMAVVAQKILAAPFAIVGSIGVVAQLPNFHRLLQKHDIDVELHTAGQFKRTLTLFGENNDEGRDKFRAELESIHQQFKQHIARYRPMLDLEKTATGEHWLANEAQGMGLVDELRTSDDYLLEQVEQRQVVAVRYRLKKGFGERFGQGASLALERTLWRWWQGSPWKGW